jgi:hypothetical protein
MTPRQTIAMVECWVIAPAIIAAAIAIPAAIIAHELTAQEFGDHPETAVARMRWARGVVGEVFAAPGPAQDGRRGRPVLPLTDLRRWRLVWR